MIPLSNSPKELVGCLPGQAFRVDHASRAAIAIRDIKPNETIMFLSGEIVTTIELVRRVAKGESNVNDPHQVEEDQYILLDERSKYFTHSCSPNIAVSGYNRVFALQEIAQGERLQLDFSTVVGTSCFDAVWSMACECGSENCRKEIGSVLTLPIKQLQEYLKKNGLPEFIINQLVKRGKI